MRKKSMRLGGGGRFQRLAGELSKRYGKRRARAIAASIGRKKYGKRAFQRMAAAGRRRAVRARRRTGVRRVRRR